MRPDRRTGWWATAAVLAVIGLVCVAVWWAHPGQPLERETSASEPQVGAPSASARAEAGAALMGRLPARPVGLEIPAIDIDTRLTELGLNADGTVEVPANPALAGWYRLGTTPGARGSAVILGHVDSSDGPAVFYRLSSLHPGARVEVELAGHRRLTFRVRSVQVYPNASFPARKVYAARHGRILNLVTCGGEYDEARGGYQANVVVRAGLVTR